MELRRNRKIFNRQRPEIFQFRIFIIAHQSTQTFFSRHRRKTVQEVYRTQQHAFWNKKFALLAGSFLIIYDAGLAKRNYVWHDDKIQTERRIKIHGCYKINSSLAWMFL